MTLKSFLIALVVTSFVLIFIRIFWKQIVILGFIIYLVGHLTLWSLVSTILWSVFYSGNLQGWGWTWLYFFLTYTGILIVYALIILDVLDMVIAWIKSLIK
jgi:hypothetical protein